MWFCQVCLFQPEINVKVKVQDKLHLSNALFSASKPVGDDRTLSDDNIQKEFNAVGAVDLVYNGVAVPATDNAKAKVQE